MIKAKNQKENEMMDLSELLKIQKEQLENMAGSFGEFAKSLSSLPTDEEEEVNDRMNQIQKMMLLEHRRILAWQLKSFAACFAQIASENVKIQFFQDKSYQDAVQALKEYGIHLRRGYYMQTKKGMRYFFEMKVSKRGRVTLQDVAGLLSVAFDKNLECYGREQFMNDQFYHTYEMEEKSRFHMMTGFARAVKEGETISGDNGSVYERKDHHTFLMLSDGVGSGQIASKESGAALEMVESILQAGNSLEDAIYLTSSAFGLIETELHYPSFDGCCIQLEQGNCTFYKAGGVCSFLKKDNYVRIVKGGGTPLGAFPDLKLENSCYEVEDDTFVIMMTDGVLENMNVDNPEDILAHFIQVIALTNPGEIASQILQFIILQSGGKVRDDMMVCVAGIWEV